MRYLLLCTLGLFTTCCVAAGPLKIARIGEDVQSGVFFGMVIAAIHDPSAAMIERLDGWFRCTDMRVDTVYPDTGSEQLKGKTVVDLAWAGALHYPRAIVVLENVLNRAEDVSHIRLADGSDLVGTAELMMEAFTRKAYTAEQEEMMKNVPRAVQAVLLRLRAPCLNLAPLQGARTYYEVLGVDAAASQDAIKRNYRRLAAKWHPDKNLENRDKAEIGFKIIQQAHETLSDPIARQKYDSNF